MQFRAAIAEHGDTFASIAQRECGDVNLWHIVAALNPFYDFDDLEDGDIIVLPGRLWR